MYFLPIFSTYFRLVFLSFFIFVFVLRNTFNLKQLNIFSLFLFLYFCLYILCTHSGNAQLTISAIVDASKEEKPCCSRTLTENNQPNVANIEGPSSNYPTMTTTTMATVTATTTTTTTTTTATATATSTATAAVADATAPATTTTDASTKSNGHKSISTTENNTHRYDASGSISRVSSSNSIHNQIRKSSINLEPGFIETIMDDFIRKSD